MPFIRRFRLDGERRVIDDVNPSHSGKAYCHEGDPHDEEALRERVLWILITELVEKLIHNPRPREKLPSGEEYQPSNDEAHSLSQCVFNVIRASVQRSVATQLSAREKTTGQSVYRDEGLQAFTSLRLFLSELEFLLRDLYGYQNSDTLTALYASEVVCREFTRYARPILWRELSDAEAFDYASGIGVPDGSGISGSEHRAGHAAASRLRAHYREIMKDPSQFARYTQQFAHLCAEHWPFANRLDDDPDALLWE